MSYVLVFLFHVALVFRSRLLSNPPLFVVFRKIRILQKTPPPFLSPLEPDLRLAGFGTYATERKALPFCRLTGITGVYMMGMSMC